MVVVIAVLIATAAGAATQAASRPNAAWLLVGAPLCEELVFRAGLQTMLARRFGAATAVAITSLLFAVSHAAQAPALHAALTFLPSLALGATYARTTRLRHVVALHAGFNALSWLACSDALQGFAPSDLSRVPRT